MSNDPATLARSKKHELLTALKALREGDFSVRLAADGSVGTDDAELAHTFNDLAEMLSTYGSEVRRVSRELGTEGKFGPQAEVPGVRGEWQGTLTEFNRMAANLTNQIRDLARVTTEVAKGNLTRKVTVDAAGEMVELKQTINVMIDNLNVFASELTRISREVGTEGKLGGQMELPGATGIWADLITNVNLMAANLTVAVRQLSRYADGLTAENATQSQTVHPPIEGEIALLREVLEKIQARLARP